MPPSAQAVGRRLLPKWHSCPDEIMSNILEDRDAGVSYLIPFLLSLQACSIPRSGSGDGSDTASQHDPANFVGTRR